MLPKLLVPFVLASSNVLSEHTNAAQYVRPSIAEDLKVELSIRETFDSNVYLQDKDPGLPGGLPAKEESLVTTLTPKVSWSHGTGEPYQIAAYYAPDIAFYHDAKSEDHIAHRAGLTVSGRADNLAYEQANTFVWIDGSKSGPVFASPQDVPAIGGIPLRDRRDAMVYRGSLKIGWEWNDILIRPVASAYVHDFRTHQKLPSETSPLIYVNYNDRRDVNFGLDLGYRILESSRALIGYRFGIQDQLRGVSVFDPTRFADSPYDSYYHRILFGFEGAPFPWVRMNLLLGPEIRDWRHSTPTGFERSEVVYWVDASIVVQPTKEDSITFSNRRFQQPAFTSQSVYEDVTYSILWKHRFNPDLNAALGFQIYIGDWQAPVNREDWIYTPSISATWTSEKNWALELGYAYDWVENKVPISVAPSAQGREFTRHIVSICFKYSF